MVMDSPKRSIAFSVTAVIAGLQMLKNVGTRLKDLSGWACFDLQHFKRFSSSSTADSKCLNGKQLAAEDVALGSALPE